MNEIKIIRSTWHQVYSMVEEFLKTLNGPTDSFWEEKLREANVYQICNGKQPIGFFSIHREETVTSFYLQPQALADAQEIFRLAITREFVQCALVATCDELFLSLSLDVAKKVERQAYFFQPVQRGSFEEGIQLELAKGSDLAFVQKHSSDFFDDLENQISREEIYLAKDGEEVVGFGVMELGAFRKKMASVGMYVREEYRMRGYGAKIIRGLQKDTVGKARLPIAGCWVWNHGSKKTMERAGLVSQTRYMKISF